MRFCPRLWLLPSYIVSNMNKGYMCSVSLVLYLSVVVDPIVLCILNAAETKYACASVIITDLKPQVGYTYIPYGWQWQICCKSYIGGIKFGKSLHPQTKNYTAKFICNF